MLVSLASDRSDWNWFAETPATPQIQALAPGSMLHDLLRGISNMMIPSTRILLQHDIANHHG